ncbi:hypothetical protein COEREDRAFT_41520 [Coemansia reversa NRRL 1564]|uniref:T-cell immunomodulatory protein TIP C2 domain-containing protein n=1 Tax=Coemansia reversa (strain ATCC 12441 / NRRL 1564) TaxID=763665 RepID=A0A2G5BDR0_COERN|nr:hypothetical protein COEREDRAFT_41520 [Coemansia reversa NRRL 1564]|eukprot:PIA17154.1 hypothetical protein COEREDRAFT_41520 [Coemansia reversa NRRL 1564]
MHNLDWLRLGASLLILLDSALGLSGNKFRFKLDQLYEVGIGLENLRGTPAAFGDFNGDHHTDLFVISSDQKTVELWQWQKREKNFVHTQDADIHMDNGILVSNVIPGDFDMDGNLDLLVQGSKKSSSEVKMMLYLGDGASGFQAAGELPSATSALPFAFDYDGTERVDFLGVSWDQRDNATAPPTWVWSNVPVSPDANGNEDDAKQSTVQKRRRDAMCTPASPHSSAFIDLNGDCLADLFIVCDGNEEYQIWTNSELGFVYSQTGKLPSGAGPVSFADMNADGSMDLVIPILAKSQIYVLYNQQRPLCVGMRKHENCRKFKRICEDDPGFGFSLPDAHIIDISTMWHAEVLLDSLSDFQGHVAPPAVRLGDFNLDGYPDIAIVTKKGSSESRVRLLRSVSCEGCKAGKDGLLDRRDYKAVTDGVAALEQLKHVQDLAFFDIDGTGTLDILVYYLDSTGKKRTGAIYNNFFTDAFFIKAIACPTSKHIRSYSGYMSGATFKYLLVSDSGQKHVAQSAQAPQTAYRALFTPYTVIGIGRTNNYIEDFSVGSTSALGEHERSFEGLVPNSNVVIFPLNTTKDWRLELYMNRSESTPYILATLLSSMVLLAITVVTLGILERKADKHEKQRALHAINFDAL